MPPASRFRWVRSQAVERASPFCYGPAAVSSPAVVPGLCDPARRVVVERVLRTADELERLARAELPSPELEVVTRAGAVCLAGADRVVVGRGERCGVVVPGAGVSRCHAALVRQGAGWWVEDLGSRNGTWCGGERVRRRRIADGDVLELGEEPVRCRLRRR
jgi:hypothetical protein